MVREVKERPRPIDWQEVRQRLHAAGDTLARRLSGEEEREILKKRARALAREPSPGEAAERIEVLEFLLTYETYGIEMSYVRETRPLRDLTPLPCTPPFVLGLVNVRGQILSVIDLRKFFDLPERGLTDLNKVIVLQDGGMEFGILADVVLGVRSVPLGELLPSLPTLTGLRGEYLFGVTRERTTILDGKKLLGDRRLVVHEEVASQ
jgi:purine-binding chemotaxis protein CheW